MKFVSGLTSVLYVGFVGWSLYGAVVPIETYVFRMVHMGFIFALSMLVFPSSKNGPAWTRRLDIVLAALGAATIVYALWDLDKFIRRSTLPDPTDFVMGLIAILLLVEISRRAVDMTFTLVLAGFLLYAYFGQYLPGPIAHKGYDLDRIVGHMYMTLEGIFGVPLSVSVSFVTLFVVYGTFMDVAGAGTFWLELSLAVMGRKSSSAGRGALITTALLGGPQGSGVATTMSVTPVMWPILQKAGYTPDMAAGLISAGGIGAVISPPLMGAAAFLIMQFMNIPYWDVVVMVTFPTLLYYLGTFFVVEIEARKHDFRPPEMEAKPFWVVMRTRGHHLISLALLVILLGMGRSAEDSAIWALAATVATSFISRDRNEWLTPRRIYEAIVEGARNMLPVAGAARRGRHDRRGLLAHRAGAQGLQPDHVPQRRQPAAGALPRHDRLLPGRAEPADHGHLHHDGGHGGAGPGQGGAADARRPHAGLLLRGPLRGLAAGRAYPRPPRRPSRAGTPSRP